MNRPEFFLTFVLATGAACFLLCGGFSAVFIWNESRLNDLLGQGTMSLARLGALSAMVGLFVAAVRTGLRD